MPTSHTTSHDVTIVGAGPVGLLQVVCCQSAFRRLAGNLLAEPEPQPGQRRWQPGHPLLQHGRLQAAFDAPGGHVLTGRRLGVHFPFDHLPHGSLHVSLLHDITIEHRKQWPDGSRNVGLQRGWR